MNIYQGTLTVEPAYDFTARITDLTFDEKHLTFVLEGTELRPAEPHWQIDCTAPWVQSVYRVQTLLQYAPGLVGQENFDPSPVTVTAQVKKVANGLYLELRIFQEDTDNPAAYKWTLVGELSPIESTPLA